MAKAYVIEEGTTNYIPRPLFSGGWREDNLRIPPEGSGTVHLDTGTAPEGIPTTMRWELQAGPTSGTSGRFLLSDRIVEGLGEGVWTESVWARTSNPNFIPMIYTDVRGVNGGITGTMVTPTGSLPTGVEAGEWFRIILTKDDWREAEGVPINANLYLGAYPTSAGRNQTGTVEFAGPQFEPKPYATSFAHGDMGEGYSWEGTPHNSASIREPSSISIPTPEPESLYIRYSEDGEIWHNQYKIFIDEPEDAEPTLMLTSNETRDRDGEVIVEEEGAVGREPYEDAEALVLEEGTTNLIPNPRFENDMVGWSVPQGSVDRTTYAPEGGSTASARGTSTIYTTGPLGTYSILIEPSTTYTVSFWAKSTASRNFRCYHAFRSSTNQAAGSPSNYNEHVPITTEWTKCEYSFTTDSDPSIARTYFVIYADDDTLWLDNVQFEAKPYATSFTHGDMGEGYSWTGEPNNSASIREPARISAPTSEPSSAHIKYKINSGEEKENYFDVAAEREGEFTRASLLLRPEGSYSWTPEDGVQEVTLSGGENVPIVEGDKGKGWRFYADEGSATSDRYFVVENAEAHLNNVEGTVLVRFSTFQEPGIRNQGVLDTGTNAVRLYINTSGGLYYYVVDRAITLSPAIPRNTPVTSAATWKLGEPFSISGSWGDRTTGQTMVSELSVATIRIGSTLGGAPLDGIIESVLIFPEALTDAEIERISTMPEAWTMENTAVYPAKVDLEGATVMWGNDEIVVKPDRKASIASIVQYDKPLSDSGINYLSRLKAPEIQWGNVTVPRVSVALNDHSDLKRADDKITITTKKKLYIGVVVGFSRPLSPKEIAILDSTPLAYINGKTLLNLPDTTIGVSQLL